MYPNCWALLLAFNFRYTQRSARWFELCYSRRRLGRHCLVLPLRVSLLQPPRQSQRPCRLPRCFCPVVSWELIPVCPWAKGTSRPTGIEQWGGRTNMRDGGGGDEWLIKALPRTGSNRFAWVRSECVCWFWRNTRGKVGNRSDKPEIIETKRNIPVKGSQIWNQIDVLSD